MNKAKDIINTRYSENYRLNARRVNGKMKTVEVLMSTYNGEQYIEEQIYSIINQIGVKSHLTIRDDGSTDNTVEIIKKIEKEYPEKIRVHLGNNIGYRKSFLNLLYLVEEKSDYYAFSDQDDIWLENKCLIAIQQLEQQDQDINLYVCSPTICDQYMKPMFINDMSLTENSIFSYFIRSRLPGCCMVFSKQLKILVKKYINKIGIENNVPDHDFIVGAIAYAYGTVLKDEHSYILHRRLDSSITSGGKGILDRFRTEFNILFRKKGMKSSVAKNLLLFNQNLLDEDTKKFLESIKTYNNNIFNTINLIRNPEFTSGNRLLDIETKLKILIKTF